MIEIVRQIPIESQLVPSFLENIINKEISKVALNIIEQIAHFILSWIYCPYYFLYEAKLERIHYFKDDTPLIDCTNKGTVRIQNEAIFLNNIEITFTKLYPDFNIVFSKDRTEYVAIQEDAKGRPGWIQIINQEIANQSMPMQIPWSIDTTRIHEFSQKEGRQFYEAHPTPAKRPTSQQVTEDLSDVRKQLFQ